ncbi:MAG: glycyl-radical enzyme activating protein [Treponema sp.]|jgi:pyruvate formate lyase activating enzyme|nr:glycyl-radical enzyme activating protein [Treponema sp.]
MSKGIIFDIKEFAVFDGPGIRTTVFFKGCPLRCQWCHNPEGLSPEPQLMVSGAGCTHCGACMAACPSPDVCILCGRCVHRCPRGIRRMVGEEYTAEGLAKKILRDDTYLKACGGGYTLSGGEPTLQGEFLLELLRHIRGSHRAVETSGCCPGDLFSAVLEETELILLDLKAVDTDVHRKYTGADNQIILENLERLKSSGRPHIIRIPVIPGVNDTEENYSATAKLLRDDHSLVKVELLPYHKTAGAKYSMLKMSYQPDFDVEQKSCIDREIFLAGGILCTVV